MTKSTTRPPKFQSTRSAPKAPAIKPPETEPDTTTLQTQSQPPAAAADGASLTYDGSHMRSFVIPEDDEASADPDAPQQVGQDGEIVAANEAEAVQIDKDAFYVTMKTLLGAPGMFDRDFLALAIQPQEEQQARAASDSIYDLLEIWYPSALTPQSEVLGHLIIAVPFIAGKVAIIRAILSQKRARNVDQHPDHPVYPKDAPEARTEPVAQPDPETPKAMGIIS